MDPLYKPQGVEERWQRTWEEEGLYNAEADDPRPKYAWLRTHCPVWFDASHGVWGAASYDEELAAA